jgi:hypothetical protein
MVGKFKLYGVAMLYLCPKLSGTITANPISITLSKLSS